MTMATERPMRIDPPYTPELLDTVQRSIGKYLTYRKEQFTGPQRVLELGGGWSTIWLASMATVETVEHDAGWHDEICRAILRAGLSNSITLSPPQEFPDVVSAFPNAFFDLILVDCVDEARLPCIPAAIPKLKSDGWFVIDDSHWDMFDSTPDAMKSLGFDYRIRLDGQHRRKTGEVCLHQTDIYSRNPV